MNKKRKVLLAICINLLSFFLFSNISFASDAITTWNTTTSMPYLLASHTIFSSKNKLFIVGGSAATGQSHANIITNNANTTGDLNSWIDAINFPTAPIWHSVAIKDNFVYILGGKEENPGSVQDFVGKVFMGTINNQGDLVGWQIMNNGLPTHEAQGGAVVVGNWLYYLGGRIGTTGSNLVYSSHINSDGTLGSWSTSPINLPNAMFSMGAVSYNNNI